MTLTCRSRRISCSWTRSWTSWAAASRKSRRSYSSGVSSSSPRRTRRPSARSPSSASSPPPLSATTTLSRRFLQRSAPPWSQPRAPRWPPPYPMTSSGTACPRSLSPLSSNSKNSRSSRRQRSKTSSPRTSIRRIWASTSPRSSQLRTSCISKSIALATSHTARASTATSTTSYKSLAASRSGSVSQMSRPNSSWSHATSVTASFPATWRRPYSAPSYPSFRALKLTTCAASLHASNTQLNWPLPTSWISTNQRVRKKKMVTNRRSYLRSSWLRRQCKTRAAAAASVVQRSIRTLPRNILSSGHEHKRSKAWNMRAWSTWTAGATAVLFCRTMVSSSSVTRRRSPPKRKNKKTKAVTRPKVKVRRPQRATERRRPRRRKARVKAKRKTSLNQRSCQRRSAWRSCSRNQTNIACCRRVLRHWSSWRKRRRYSGRQQRTSS